MLFSARLKKYVRELKKPGNSYINEAIDFYNRIQYRQIPEKKLRKEYSLVRGDSMSALNDFEEIDYAD